MTITGRTVWITGACSAIGQQLVQQLAATGNHVIASGPEDTTLQRLVESCRGAVTRLPMDPDNAASIDRAASRLPVITDRLDIAIIVLDYRDLPTSALLAPFTSELTAVAAVMERLYFSSVRILGAAKPLLRQSALPQLAVVDRQERTTLSPSPAFAAAGVALNAHIASLSRDPSNPPISVLTARVTPARRKRDGRVPTRLLPMEQAVDAIVRGIARGKTRVELGTPTGPIRRLAQGFAALFHDKQRAHDHHQPRSLT